MLTTTLALGLFVAIAINNLHQQYLRKGKGRKFLQTAFTLCLIMLTNTFISNGSSKDYILDSAKWMQNNSPQDAKILTNDAIVGYYSDRHFNSGLQSSDTEYLILSKPPLEFDYLVIKVKAKRTDFSKKFDERYKNIKAEKIFSNARGDKIAIYKNHAG